MSNTYARIAAAIVAVALVTTSCSSSKNSGSGAPSTGAPASSAPAPAGPAVVLGFINQEKGSTVTFPDQRAGAEAAVKLVNEQGGINGHPLKLDECMTDGSPESSQACANQMVQAKVAIVQSGTDFGDTASIPILKAAHIVYVPTLPFQAGHFATDGVFTFFGGAPAETSAEVQTALAHGDKKVGMLVLNVPAAVTAAKSLIQKPLAAKGVDVNIVTFDANTADFTPSFTALTQNKPDEIIIFTSGPQCGQIMQAAGSLGIDVPVQYPSDCLNKDYLAVGGSGADGALFMMETLQTSLRPDDPGVKLYLDAMKRFAGKNPDQLSNSHQTAFIATYSIAHLLSTIDGAITGASVKAAFEGAKNVPSIMTEPYSCDGSALPGYSSICNAGVMVVQRKGSELVELTGQWIKPATG